MLTFNKLLHPLAIAALCALSLSACITPDNEVIEGLGTPDLQCGPIPSVIDGSEYKPRTDPVPLAIDGRQHPDIFYLGWSKLDERSDLRFPEAGYDDGRYEDRLLVSRKQADGSTKTWQLLPLTDNDCQDLEQIRVHSFDVAPNGKSLYVSMARTPNGGPADSHLGIYRFDIENFGLTKISKDDETHFMYPTYVGNDPDTRHEMLVVAKTVTDDELPVNYALRSTLVDEYDRAPTPLIHKMDAHTGQTTRIGFNNSHQTEPFVMVGPDNNRVVVFTQWEHQDTVNRFALWKTQIDGSDNFTFFGQESSLDKSAANLFQSRVIRSGPYKNYILMTEGHHKFDAEGHIAMTFRHHQELRSARHYLQKIDVIGSTNTNIARSPEHYNDDSFIYSYREDSNYTYKLYVKDFPETPSATPPAGSGELLSPVSDAFHFVQARSFYPPERDLIAPTDAADLGENRVSFTNNNLNGKAGFLVQDLTKSDNGVQHQLDGLSPDDISMQFFIPSHHFGDSNTIGLKNSAEMSIPASGFIKPESDGSMGVVMKDGLYVWKVNKRYNYGGSEGASGNDGDDIWIPVRSERQEISFVPNRVNACNQCHQERDEANLHLYTNLSDTIAETKMRGNLDDVPDISNYNAAYSVPDFHKDIMPLFTDPAYKGPTGKTCAECHSAGTKLDLSNTTGPEAMNSTFRTIVRGAHKLPSGNTVPYSNDSINPMGLDDSYHPAPFLWSLLLNDDLAPAQSTGSGDRAINEVGDYGASFDQEVKNSIASINGQYDHSKHWSAADIQKFITYSSTQMPAGLSDRMNFATDGTSDAWRKSAVAQKAYQAMVNSCFSCHNSFTGNYAGGTEDPSFGLPEDKSFSIATGQRDKRMRFMIHNHVHEKGANSYSPLALQSNLNYSMSETLLSAAYQINFDDPENSSILKHALGLSATTDRGTGIPRMVNHQATLSETDPDYLAIKNWVTGNTSGTLNQAPVIDTALSDPIIIKEYDAPKLGVNLSWSDPDGLNPSTSSGGPNSGNEYSQVFIGGDRSKHSMLAMQYKSFNSADLEAYAILGDAQKTSVDFIATDGQQASQPLSVPVIVTTDYNVPAPDSTFPDAYAFYTTRTIEDSSGNVLTAGGELHKISTVGGVKNDELIGTINGYSNDWSTVYRRADRGWLYFLNQKTQTVHVVDETNAKALFNIKLDLSLAKETSTHKQTVYLLWWRPNDGDGNGDSDDMDHLGNKSCPHGELQGLMESKLSETKNGDFYIGLGCGEMVDANSVTEATSHNDVIDPANARFDTLQQSGHQYTYQHPSTYRTKLENGGNTLAVYTWRRATFMSRWVNEGVDELNVLNLVTGKDKELGDFNFPTASYDNVRAIVVGEDGAFYGFNKDTNTAPVEMFSFDPLTDTQVRVNTPDWLDEYFNNYPFLGTPFLVIEPRNASGG